MMLKAVCLAVLVLACVAGLNTNQRKQENQKETQQLKAIFESKLHKQSSLIKKLQSEFQQQQAQMQSFIQTFESRMQEVESEKQDLQNQVNQLQQEVSKYHAQQNVVSFTAYATEYRDYDINQTVLFDGTLANYGGFYNAATSNFICPVDGYYLFSVHIDVGSIYNMRVGIEVDSVLLSMTHGREQDQASTSVVYRCPFAARVRVVCLYNGESMYGGDPYSVFSGTLLFAA